MLVDRELVVVSNSVLVVGEKLIHPPSLSVLRESGRRRVGKKGNFT